MYTIMFTAIPPCYVCSLYCHIHGPLYSLHEATFVGEDSYIIQRVIEYIGSARKKLLCTVSPIKLGRQGDTMVGYQYT